MVQSFASSSLLTAITSFSLGLFVIWKNRSKLNWLWFATSMGVAFWSFGLYREVLSSTYAWALFWNRILYVGAIFLPVFFYHFTLLLLEIDKKKWLLRAGYIFSFIFLILNFTTTYFVKGVPPMAGFNYWVEEGE